MFLLLKLYIQIELKISLDDYILKNVPVALNLVVNPAPGYVQIGETLIKPSQIEIAGPERRIRFN